MLDTDICQEIDHIHIIPSMIYTRVCIMVLTSLLHDSMPHSNQI